MKLTQQRLEIFKELLDATDHLSAEVIHSGPLNQMPTVALDTIYRTLATFAELGLGQKLHIANEQTLFDPVMDIHHHFICTQCKKVEDLYWQDFDKTILPNDVAKLGTVTSRHLELHGLCHTCRQNRH